MLRDRIEWNAMKTYDWQVEIMCPTKWIHRLTTTHIITLEKKDFFFFFFKLPERKKKMVTKNLEKKKKSVYFSIEILGAAS